MRDDGSKGEDKASQKYEDCLHLIDILWKMIFDIITMP